MNRSFIVSLTLFSFLSTSFYCCTMEHADNTLAIHTITTRHFKSDPYDDVTLLCSGNLRKNGNRGFGIDLHSFRQKEGNHFIGTTCKHLSFGINQDVVNKIVMRTIDQMPDQRIFIKAVLNGQVTQITLLDKLTKGITFPQQNERIIAEIFDLFLETRFGENISHHEVKSDDLGHFKFSTRADQHEKIVEKFAASQSMTLLFAFYNKGQFFHTVAGRIIQMNGMQLNQSS